MHRSNVVNIAVLMVAVLAGCGSRQDGLLQVRVPRSNSVLPFSDQEKLARQPAPMPPVSLGANRSVGLRGGILFAASYNGSFIACYPQNGFNQSPFGYLGVIGVLSRPQGMAGAGGALYVANTGASNVLVFDSCGALQRTMNDQTGFPVDVAVDHSGNAYVTNINDVGGGNGEIRKYAVGDNSGVLIGDPLLSSDFFVAVDRFGNLFVDGLSLSSGAPELDWLPCCGASTNWRRTGIRLGYPGGLGIDKSGNVLVDDQSGTFTAYAIPGFRPTGISFACPGRNCVDFALSRSGDEVWIADASAGVIYGVQYPQGRLQDLIYDHGSLGIVAGVAVTSR